MPLRSFPGSLRGRLPLLLLLFPMVRGFVLRCVSSLKLTVTQGLGSGGGQGDAVCV